VDVLVGDGDVLDHQQHGVLAGQARRDVAHGVQPRQRMERTTVVARRQIRGAHHRERRGEEHVLHGRAGGELVVGLAHDALGRRVLDELHQGLDPIGIPNAVSHAPDLPQRSLGAALRWPACAAASALRKSASVKP
jgi:hypothetical protein